MAGTDRHDIDLPMNPFDLMNEIERFRNMRNDVISSYIANLMDKVH